MLRHFLLSLLLWVICQARINYRITRKIIPRNVKNQILAKNNANVSKLNDADCRPRCNNLIENSVVIIAKSNVNAMSGSAFLICKDENSFFHWCDQNKFTLAKNSHLLN